ncbi:hypothetical protein C5167_013691 [Papaver somniferum]|uniref:Uncharacterized protein n=1 Tax=Papaver somniferum TaxID=3469 RepID=A0A4Y7J523_PAPSO|nr:hypothetical protein C5167_013691 [Papaver somniferum]
MALIVVASQGIPIICTKSTQEKRAQQRKEKEGGQGGRSENQILKPKRILTCYSLIPKPERILTCYSKNTSDGIVSDYPINVLMNVTITLAWILQI